MPALTTSVPRGKPVLIDTLSFEIFREGEPWVLTAVLPAFSGALALMALKDIRLSQLMRIYIDGVRWIWPASFYLADAL